MVVDWRERDGIRKTILHELYQKNHENGGKPVSTAPYIKDNEKRAALVYWEDKGYVKLIKFDHPTFSEARITAQGIEEVEINIL